MNKINWNNDVYTHTKNDKNQDQLTTTLDNDFKISFVFEGSKSIKQIDKELLSILIK